MSVCLLIVSKIPILNHRRKRQTVTSLLEDVWYHVVITWSLTAGLKVYINGFMVAQMDGATRIPPVCIT